MLSYKQNKRLLKGIGPSSLEAMAVEVELGCIKIEEGEGGVSTEGGAPEEDSNSLKKQKNPRRVTRQLTKLIPNPSP